MRNRNAVETYKHRVSRSLVSALLQRVGRGIATWSSFCYHSFIEAAFVKRDHAAEQRLWEKMSADVAESLRSVSTKGITVTMPAMPWIHVVITFPDRAHAARAVSALETGRPRVFVASNRISNAEVVVIPQNVLEDEVPTLIRRLHEAIESTAKA